MLGAQDALFVAPLLSIPLEQLALTVLEHPEKDSYCIQGRSAHDAEVVVLMSVASDALCEVPHGSIYSEGVQVPDAENLNPPEAFCIPSVMARIVHEPDCGANLFTHASCR